MRREPGSESSDPRGLHCDSPFVALEEVQSGDQVQLSLTPLGSSSEGRGAGDTGTHGEKVLGSILGHSRVFQSHSE